MYPFEKVCLCHRCYSALIVVELICPRDLYPHASAVSTHCGDIHLVRSAALPVSFARPYALHWRLRLKRRSERMGVGGLLDMISI